MPFARVEEKLRALDRLDEARPSLILLDLMMPVMDGFAFLRALRGRPDGDVPVVVLTAKEITTEEKASLDHQADRLIIKGSLSLAEIGRQLRDLYDRQGNGPVSDELKDVLFEPFRQGEDSSGRGMGIGLSLVQRFAELHGGSARIEDAAAGGARFVVELPGEVTPLGKPTDGVVAEPQLHAV